MIVYQESEKKLFNNEYLERLQYQRYQNGGYRDFWEKMYRDFYVMSFVSLIVLILLAG